MRAATRVFTLAARRIYSIPPSPFLATSRSSLSRTCLITTKPGPIRYYCTETEKPSESANLPQWAAKTDADISELKNQKNITYEMVEPLLSRNPILAGQAEALFKLATDNKVKNLDKKYDDAVKEVNIWKKSNPMTRDIYFSLIDGYAKITEVNSALLMWDEMNQNKVPGSDQLYGVVMKLFEKQGKKEKVLELYERCKKEGIKASGAIYDAYINATIGYKPAKYRKKK